MKKCSKKIKVRGYHEAEDPEVKDDLLYIGENVTVQVGPDYFMVILGYRGAAGNLTHTVFPHVKTVKECAKIVEKALKGKKK